MFITLFHFFIFCQGFSYLFYDIYIIDSCKGLNRNIYNKDVSKIINNHIYTISKQRSPYLLEGLLWVG